MTAFPASLIPLNLPTGGTPATSGEDWADDLAIDRAPGGGCMVRAFYSVKKRTLSLAFVLDASGRTSLETFYDANRVGPAFTIRSPFDGSVRTVLFAAAPLIDWLSPTLSRAHVLLVEA
jgi:hypothetical protein